MPIGRTARAVHNRETRWDRLSRLHRRITLIVVNRFAAGKRASAVALIRYYRVGTANVMKFGSPLGSKGRKAGPRCEKGERIAKASRGEKRKENAFEALVEPDGVALQALCQSGLCCVPLLGLIEAPSAFPIRAPVCATTHDRLKSYLVFPLS